MQEYVKSDLIGQLRELHSILFIPEHNEYFTLIQENKEEFEIKESETLILDGLRDLTDEQ